MLAQGQLCVSPTATSLPAPRCRGTRPYTGMNRLENEVPVIGVMLYKVIQLEKPQQGLF